ncbi:MAG TPA: bifunctional [glutamate--ammonia ligase]-adenylyl-L-tyrosine phosphorylase/[glutamate--ammonia-ligase] adenylyltransferase [Gallionella sp.]|nr:MAG: bifunctional glutamine synthetase adenylyltransferase/deadenyltransferase [Gallionellales bacterium GWA2_54_124]OGT20099.1 MAG: bifunctional glutamine synthetase adenylyltransferase/deadenyltransferase [Gallionellales bacterium RIFOXYD12_FULL_53_10]HCI52060.1 bifunctional [glutamate--ammonia ligase]-adenylyl-L-tyrosine phosphorylase/[glutamate--ammonia-ligase] adenylyltransferase [Gallionella sp.]
MLMNTENSLSFSEFLYKTMRCSRYAKRILETDAVLLEWLALNYATPCCRDDIQHLLEQLNPTDETTLARAVRRLRKQVMVKLILRDLNGLCDLNEVMQAMTALAEIVVQQAQARLMESLQQQFGSPIGEISRTAQQLLVIGMGKLGGGELNVSSDIDLIFVYAEDGETNGARVLSNHEFFTRLGRRLINIINEATGDGYVFRVDMRLRPYGDSGPLVMSFAALEEYLVSQGREWERYAWIKARVVSPASHPWVTELNQLYQPFVFRKYLDFGAIDSMRKLHAQIRQEVQRRDRLDNIKLGPGGIREIEFTAQVFQLIRGGQDARLRILPTQRVLKQLVENGQMADGVVADLDAAYVFLRNLEHRLQYLDDQQTQALPVSEEDRLLIASAMDFDDYPALLQVLDRHRAVVIEQFEQIFGASVQEPSLLWREDVGAEELSDALGAQGYRAANESAQRLLQLRGSVRYQQLSELSRQRVDGLIPQFIALSVQYSDPDTTLSRLLTLLDAISRRAVYLAFLAEYPQALSRLTRLLSASSWAASFLAQHPALFDELLDAREMYRPPEWTKIDLDLQARLAGCGSDVERRLEVLHQVQQEKIFYFLAMDLQGLLPLETLSDHLSDLADLILRHVLNLCWANARKRHTDQPCFAIIAYGKLGGKEMGYASDLDMIFLYDDEHPDAQENYARLGKSINAMLGSYTASGRLYETDLRLRPNGASGLLVSSVGAFAEYQKNEAWVWEHQALSRARFSAGDALVGQAFEAIRQQVLSMPRDIETLRHEIITMRQKMHDGHPNNSPLFDIKHDSGGMVDIEFMVQYLVLAYAHQYPELTANVGNLALLKMAAEVGLIDQELACQTRILYRSLRQIQHRMRLNDATHCRVMHDEIDTRAGLALWAKLLGATAVP